MKFKNNYYLVAILIWSCFFFASCGIIDSELAIDDLNSWPGKDKQQSSIFDEKPLTVTDNEGNEVDLKNFVVPDSAFEPKSVSSLYDGNCAQKRNKTDDNALIPFYEKILQKEGNHSKPQEFNVNFE